MKFSIITVCLNAGSDLAETVSSILNQTYDDYELIIKDGMSTVGSIEKLPQNSHIRLVQCSDSGIYDAMNQGIREATGDYCIFINAGDRLFEETILASLAESVRDGAALYYGCCYNETMQVYSSSPQKLTPFFCYRSMICHQAMIIKRNILIDKLYDTSYRVCADRELLLYIVVGKKLPTKYLSLVIARYKGSGFCETEENQRLMKTEHSRMIKEYYSNSERFRFFIAYHATMPMIRKGIVRNKKLSKIYKRYVRKIYRNKSGNANE